MKQFKVREFRFLSEHDDRDEKYEDWSRPYEYRAVIKALGPGFIGAIHNTASGVVENQIYPYNVSRLFADSLSLEIPKAIVYNTDYIMLTDPEQVSWYRRRFNYYYFDLRNEWEGDEFEAVLCISVLEHIYLKDQLKVIQSLINQTKSGGRCIMTFDYPQVNRSFFEGFFGCKCVDTDNRLSGKNSIHPNLKYQKLNIIFLDLEVL